MRDAAWRKRIEKKRKMHYNKNINVIFNVNKMFFHSIVSSYNKSPLADNYCWFGICFLLLCQTYQSKNVSASLLKMMIFGKTFIKQT